MLIRYGWQEYSIVRRLGLKDGTMLYRVYGHLFPNHDADLVMDLERRLQASREAAGTVITMPGIVETGTQWGHEGDMAPG